MASTHTHSYILSTTLTKVWYQASLHGTSIDCSHASNTYASHPCPWHCVVAPSGSKSVRDGGLSRINEHRLIAPGRKNSAFAVGALEYAQYTLYWAIESIYFHRVLQNKGTLASVKYAEVTATRARLSNHGRLVDADCWGFVVRHRLIGICMDHRI
jgi:hypothetical protein